MATSDSGPVIKPEKFAPASVKIVAPPLSMTAPPPCRGEKA